MKAGVAVLLLLTGALGPGGSDATEIQGKWGVGVAIGSLFSSGAEASIIRGTSARTAWIGDFAVSVSSDHRNATTVYRAPYYPDTTITGGSKSDRIAIEVGPRLRRFTNPGNTFSPYLDVYAHFVDSISRNSNFAQSQSDVRVGGKVGIAIGAEYFSTRWPFSVAAHTDLATFTAAHESGRGGDPSRVSTDSGTLLSGSFTLRPVVQVRVYW